MNEERELLERVIAWFNRDSLNGGRQKLIDDIEQYLSKPEKQQLNRDEISLIWADNFTRDSQKSFIYGFEAAEEYYGITK